MRTWPLLTSAFFLVGLTGCPQEPPVEPIQLCTALSAYDHSSEDATDTFQACIDATPSGEILELPAIRFGIRKHIRITRPITIRTEGKKPNDPPCTSDNQTQCAEILFSANHQSNRGGIKIRYLPEDWQYDEDGTPLRIELDHLIVNGNRQRRYQSSSANSCQAGQNQAGFNLSLVCSHCSFTNSVSMNALCGSGLELSGAGGGGASDPFVPEDLLIENSEFTANGVHTSRLWADGLTVHIAKNSTFTQNTFIDNTDIAMIFGGCKNCLISENTFLHSDLLEGSSFAELMIQSWPVAYTDGNYLDSSIEYNLIDCGPSRRCGIGLLIGSHPWYQSPVSNVAARKNTIQNAQFGLVLDALENGSFEDNVVINGPIAGSTIRTSCGQKTVFDTFISADSKVETLDFGLGLGNLPPDVHFAPGENLHCIPNWEFSTNPAN